MTATRAAGQVAPQSHPGQTEAGFDSRTLMTIGEVLAHLRPEFPDITISKLRFLESEGLVEPYRAPSGYRKYTGAHLERLRFVLAAQRDRYLPLRVIREHLAASDRGERTIGMPSAPVTSPAPMPAAVAAPAEMPSAPPAPSHLPHLAPSPRGEVSDVRLTRSQLADRSGMSDEELAELESYGLLAPNSEGYFGGEALTVARAAAALAEYGLQARHLRAYRAAADREIGLLSQLAVPIAKHGGAAGRERAIQTVHELASLCATLHGALVRQGLRQVLVP